MFRPSKGKLIGVSEDLSFRHPTKTANMFEADLLSLFQDPGMIPLGGVPTSANIS